MKLVVGLCNGIFAKTSRHSIGAHLVGQLASKLGLHWELYPSLLAYVVQGCSVILVWPLSAYNSSGYVVERCARRFHVKHCDVCVVHDDIEIKAGDIRHKVGGSCRGNKGLQSCEQNLDPDFERIRIGVGPRPKERDRMTIFSFVLASVPEADLVKISAMWSKCPFVAGILQSEHGERDSQGQSLHSS